MFQFTLIAQALAVTTAINVAVFAVSWRRRRATGGREFALGMLAATVWTLAATLDYAAVPLSLKIFFAKVEYAASFAALTFFAMFAICFAGMEEWLEVRGRRLLFSLPAALPVGLAWTNELHGWLWSGFRPSAFGENTVIFEHGPGYPVAMIIGYGLVGVICSNLWQVSLHGGEVARRQAHLILAATIFPILAHLVYLLQDPVMQGVDWNSITFSVTGAFTLVALYAAGFLDLAPIAREQLVARLTDGLIVADPGGRVVEINQRALEMLDRSPEDVAAGQELREILGEIPEVNGLDPQEEGEFDLSLGDQGRTFEVRITPLFRQRNRLAGRLLLLHDITERRNAEQAMQRANEQLEMQLREIERLQESLREQAIRDPLTRLPNRRRFDDVIERELRRADRRGRSMALVAIDLDHFKRINDRHGHAAGDTCLLHFASLISARLRSDDFACRYGGEEFLVILPDTDLDGAESYAESLREHVAGARIALEKEQVRLTVSIGVAVSPLHGDEPAELIDKADRALYRAKQLGRDRVVCFAKDWRASARVLA